LESYAVENIRTQLNQVAAALAANAGDSATLATFEENLRALEQPGGSGFGFHLHGYSSLEIPNLLRSADRETVTPLLIRALRLDSPLNIWQAGEPTRRLLSELALKHIDELKRPFWELVASFDDVALYEAMAKKFPGRRNDRT